MKSVAYPQLNAVTEDGPLEHLCATLMDLCNWERNRADALDRKASYMLGLAGLAAVVFALVSDEPGSGVPIVAMALVAGLLLAVLLSLITLWVSKYGGFLDDDVFEALGSCHKPIGDLSPYDDKDPYRCLLRESSLQRWLVYRGFSAQNDRKAKCLVAAQTVAGASLVGVILLLVLT